jgi:RNA polymerase sigma factor (sigma-70 family)
LGNRQLFPAKSPKELLADFKETGANAPFEEIVRRYAAMVYGVCLRVTDDKHDAEDATQAVFLSLALQAKTSREIKYIGPWLQKVAHRLALDVKKSKTRRKKREEKLADETRHAGANGNGHNGHHPAFTGGNGHGINPADSPGNEELKTIMMEELNQLPPKYRMPLVMHYFGGLSRDEMADQLGCNPSTLGVRVHRGKAMLGTRLAKRGVAISAIALAVLLEHAVKSAAIQPLVASGSAVAGGGAMIYAGGGSGAMSSAARVIALIRTAARAVAFAKLKTAVAIVLVVISFTFSAQASVRKYIQENLRLPMPSFDVARWIRPLLQNFLPDLRAEATEKKPLNVGLDEVPAVVANTPPLPIEPDSIFGVRPIPPLDLASAQPPVRTVAPTPARDVELMHPPQPQYSAFAQLILDPPALRQTPSAFTLSAVTAPAIGGDDASLASGDGLKPPDQPIAASASDMLVGAGGGGGGGKPELYVLPANTTLRSGNVVVGDDNGGAGLFRNLGGTHFIAGDLTLGRKKGSSGQYENSGTVVAQREIIGDGGDGSFIQTRGVNIAEQSIIVGQNGAGRYRQTGGETIVMNSYVPTATTTAGGGTFTDADAVAIADTPNGLHLGQNPGSSGSYTLADGSLTATPQIIGNSGTGTFFQSGGVNSSGLVVLGASTGGVGEYKLIGGKLILISTTGNISAFATASGTTTSSAGATTGGTIRIGDNGHGTFSFGNSGGTGAVYSVGDASSVVVRGKPTGDGVIVGHGRFDLHGMLVNNSQIIADGYRKERSLDLSSFTKVTSNIENPPWGGEAGWFARRKGMLMLPPIAAKHGTGQYTWGEDAADPLIDLVNSVRFKIHGAHDDGDVAIALLSPLRADVPTLPDGHKFIGLWSFDGSDLGGFDAIDIQVRYDDAMAETLGLPEHILKLWEYNSATATWNRLDGDPLFARDGFNHLLSARFSSDMTYFAASAPEPSGAVIVIIAGATLLCRRRHN